jgi:restriction endonuclease S subunit
MSPFRRKKVYGGERTNSRCSQTYLYFWLDQPGMTQKIKNLNANAAQPGINQVGVKGLPILLADSLPDTFSKV